MPIIITHNPIKIKIKIIVNVSVTMQMKFTKSANNIFTVCVQLTIVYMYI